MVFIKKEMVSDNMRFYVSDDGYINDVLSFIMEDIKKYNWIVTDMEAYVFIKDSEMQGEEIPDTIFERENFYISGEELYDFLNKYGILAIFCVVIAVEKTCENVLKNIPCYPVIQDNENYWKEDYFLTIPESIMEFGFFDTTCLIFASRDEYVIQKYKKAFPTAILYTKYLES